MEEKAILEMWNSHEKKIMDTIRLNRQNASDITALKIKSLLASMSPVKIFTLAAGLIWVIAIDALIISLFNNASPFFIVSAILQVLVTKIAIGIYIYQLVLIHETDISKPVIETQQKLARLRSSTIWVTRILILQLPAWTTFYLNMQMFEQNNWILTGIQLFITLFFTFVALWLFVNIRYANRNKKWFRFIFNGKEWEPVIQSMKMLEELDEYRVNTTRQQ